MSDELTLLACRLLKEDEDDGEHDPGNADDHESRLPRLNSAESVQHPAGAFSSHGGHGHAAHDVADPESAMDARGKDIDRKMPPLAREAVGDQRDTSGCQ